jgi:hypothetical protein
VHVWSGITHMALHSKHSNLGGDSGKGEEIVSQSDEVGAVTFDIIVNLATDILQSPLSYKSHVYND